MNRLSSGRVAFAVLCFAGSAALAEEAAPPQRASGVEEIIVTAQKREENVNDVGMSIQAASGEKLQQLGIVDTAQLDRVVTGFTSNVTYYGTAIYTIRGIGFQDTALASQPTVSVYLDQMPLQFAILTQGAVLDLQRVEVLKGPQGTLFGQNATGGAVNYIAGKPTDNFESGFDGTYGRFNWLDGTGFVSGPITDTLRYRFAARVIDSGTWQETYVNGAALPPDPYWTAAGQTYSFKDDWGEQKFYNTRLSLEWQPSDALTALFTFNAFWDKGQSQMPQMVGVTPLNPVNALNPLIMNYPRPPRRADAASWGPCVNTSGGTPADVSGQINTANRLYDFCHDPNKDNKFWSPSLRVDYQFSDGLTLTSLTSYNNFNRSQELESDGTIYQDYESSQDGDIETFFQELRVAGDVVGKGNWVVGANFEHTRTFDSFLQTYGLSTAVPTLGIPLGPTNPNSLQRTDTWAVFGNIEYPMWETITLQGGLRYTNQQRDYRGCGSDGGDGTWADISQLIQTGLQFLNGFPLTGGVDVGPGNCGSTGPPPTYAPIASGFTGKLNQDNVSWRTGVNWTPNDKTLIYGNVSQGYKSGSFPTVASAAFTQLFPAKQEKLLAYEVGSKLGLFDNRVQLNTALFYYDYTDKQILGAINDAVFGSLPALVNVPESHVIGYEVSLVWEPIDGLTISPAISYADTEIDGNFRNFDPFYNPVQNGSTKLFTGEPFPNAPKWTSNVDVQYQWSLRAGMTAFVGAHYNYQSSTKGFFYDRCNEPPGSIDPVTGLAVTCTKTYFASIPGAYGDTDLAIPSRGLLDLWAGVDMGQWRVYAWGRNVTDDYYWNQVQHVNDVLLRYTGMPVTYGLTVSYRSGH
jgi:outer membrane receptor protein involved in Fe transport